MKTINQILAIAGVALCLAACSKSEKEKVVYVHDTIYVHDSDAKAETSKPTQTPDTSAAAPAPKPAPPIAKINGHDCVDMGLSVRWATCNVGAQSPTDSGNYYAWGETNAKVEYNDANCAHFGVEMGAIGGNAETDPARDGWGGTWRLPTKAECQELIDKCAWEWDGAGYKITAENGSEIFLPASGYYSGASLFYAGDHGKYQTATPDPSNPKAAWSLSFSPTQKRLTNSSRSYGLTVRPVSE